MPAVYEYRHVVCEDEIDDLGHANNVCFVAWMQQVSCDHTAAQGWSTERYLEVGAVWMVRKHEITYLQPAMLGDEIIARTWVASITRMSSIRHYEIIRAADERVLARAVTTWAFVDLKTGGLRPVLPELAAAFDVVGDEQCTP